VGQSSSGTGISGDSLSGIGILGTSSVIGVRGFSDVGTGVVGQAQGDGTGLLGYSGTGSGPAAQPKTGVYGYAAQDATARGVTGQSTAGRGVNGIATTGRGTQGQATTGYGVYGLATSGVGIYGLASTGYALRTNGRVRLDKSAGSVVVTAGTNSKTVTPGVDLTATSFVLATLQASAGGTTTVHRVAINTVADTFTIYLTANATVNVRVGWILLS
jgi:hypothetical protein